MKISDEENKVKSITGKYIKATILLVGIITICMSMYRCFLGVDIGDEALYISDPLFVVHGSTPYVNNWLQTPGFSFFLAPIVALYELFVPTHQGIFLFMRLFFCIAKLLVYLCICLLFRNSSYKPAYMIVWLPLVSSYFSMIPSFNYTNIPILGLFFAGILLLYQWYKQNMGKCEILPYFNGIILACITLCSPTQILNCALILLIYFFCFGKKASRRYFLGGITTALIFSIYMVARAGSLANFIKDINTFLKHPYFSFGASTLTWQAYQILPMAIECSIPYVISFLIVEAGRHIFLKKYSICISCRMGLTIGAFAGMAICLLRYNQFPLWNRVIITLCIGSFFFRFLCDSKELNKLFDFVAIPEMVTFLGMALTVYGGAASRFYVFIPMALICLLYIYDILRELVGSKCFFLIGVYVILFLIITLKYEMFTIYGEFTEDSQYMSPSALKTRVENGVYAGIYTTNAKATAVQELETYIRTNTSKEEFVLFMDRVPMAYLMTEAHPCSPTSWDPQLYSEGNREKSTMLEDYFTVVGKIPDKVIYVDIGSNEGLSIESDEYDFTQYVKSHYDIKDTVAIGDMYKMMIYVEKQK